MEPHLREIGIRVEMARAAHPDGPLTGEDVFPKIPRDAKTWDDLAAMGKPAAAIAQMLAALWAWEAEEAAESGNGFAAG
jgi:hypothetical protein